MQIVINISDYDKEWVTNGVYIPDEINRKIAEAIINGIPLPKHGRLIDADEAIKTLKSLGNRDYRREKGTIQDAEKMLSCDGYTPTIIEADKEESEDKTN